jgi:hypothetical protein
MERTQIYLTSEEAAALDELAAERGVTRSRLIRDAIDATYVTPRRSQRDRFLAVVKELGAPWVERSDVPDGAAYVERIRAGRSPLDLPQSSRVRGASTSRGR